MADPGGLTPGRHLADLVAVMDRLRSPGGCPWDAEQTHESLLPYAVEEVHEVVEAVESGDRAHLREELGDLLLQVVFHARIAQEHPEEPFDLDDVAAGIAAKLRRRHPHVFGEDAGREDLGAGDVHERWERLKQEEKARESVLDGIPATMPALARAQKVIGRLRRAGLLEEALDRAGETAAGGTTGEPGADGATGEPGADGATGEPDADGATGEALLRSVVAAQAAGTDAEAALRAAVRRLEARARALEP